MEITVDGAGVDAHAGSFCGGLFLHIKFRF